MTKETQHTPGPWVKCDNKIVMGVNNQYNGQLITTVGGSEYLTDKKNEANALLIAAAPDMLREMEALAQALEDTGHEPPQSFYDAINKARGV